MLLWFMPGKGERLLNQGSHEQPEKGSSHFDNSNNSDEYINLKQAPSHADVARVYSDRLNQLEHEGKWPLFPRLNATNDQIREEAQFLSHLHDEVCRELGYPWPPQIIDKPGEGKPK